jgi:beta-glucosidase
MFDKKLIFLFISLLVFITACSTVSDPPVEDDKPIYDDPQQPVGARVEDLLKRMTIEEKIGQVTQVERVHLKSTSDIQKYFIGSILSGGGSSPSPNLPASWADMYDEYQSEALKTRLGIPMIYGIDAVHGHNNVWGAVIFPHNIGLGCTRNPGLVKRAMEIVAIEVAGTGIDWTFAPCIAVPQDERWGRTYEGFAETPILTQEMSEASVSGLQGTNLADPATILACAKHYLGDGGTLGGVDQGDTQVDEQTLLDIHLPGYIGALNQDVGTIMVSYNSWNGEKLHGHDYLLQTLLKDQLGFDGFLISDWAAIDQLPGDYISDVENSMNAGLDMIMIPDRYEEFISNLTSLVEKGTVSASRLDDAVRRILTIKFRLGLFEQPYADRTYTGSIGSAEHREVARECVQQSLVLLKNESNILPLNKNLQRIHVAGKNADDLGNQCGGWTISWQGSSGNITIGTTILEGIENTVSTSTNVTFSLDGSGAAGSDVGLVVIGETPYAEGQGDRADLRLSSEDIEAVENINNSGVPVVVVIVSGRPLIIDSILDKSDAIVAAWLPGSEGQGVADVLFGDVNPVGKLSHSWPREMSQIPINYGDNDYDPLFPYGFGLTYE